MNDREVLKRVEEIINAKDVQEYFSYEDMLALEAMYKQYKKYIENV